ncbi:hypothetical protein BMS3Bbin10_00734 [bacterium BMS3Bbin10]|nr:hypothetical protein BMS3Bbin10_00734 [bacterium BMS3Bbin10]
MRLSEYEQDMLSGKHGWPRQFGMDQIVKVGNFFDAEDCVEVAQVHLMADTESLGEDGVVFLEKLAGHPPEERAVKVPTVTDPRGIDFEHYKELGQSDRMADLERRAIDAFREMGVMMTDTCINYQTIMPPVLGEHLAFGDTGSSIYANSVQGARTNFQGGPSALASALTGRAPRYGFHLEEYRRGRKIFKVDHQPRDFADWGALGGVIGRQMESYWDVPVVELDVLHRRPTSDELKHFGAALASYGSTALFHMVGVTPEAFDGRVALVDAPETMGVIGTSDINAFIEAYWPQDDVVDVVVFAAPQLSLMEISEVADLLDGQQINEKVALIATVSPEVKTAADRMGVTAKIEGAGGMLLQGVCFYQMCAREIGEAKGWKRLLTNSAKLVNIIGGYGYEPVLASLECCVESAIQGRLVR